MCRNSPWSDIGAFHRQLVALTEQGVFGGTRYIDWVWGAGIAGFGASESEAGKELELFTAFVDAAECSRAGAAAERSVRVHFISSAGGLYEGRRVVDVNTRPAPVRAYGRLKLRQEGLGVDRFGAHDAFIYRLSSVYGYIRSGKRLGLVTTLLGNTLRQQMTGISGRLDTLRDYVWVDDVARYICSRILDENSSAGHASILASARPASIHEIRLIVRRVTRRPSYIYCTSTENAEHITFAPSVLPDGFASSMLETCVHQILLDALCKGGPWPRRILRIT